MKEEKRVGMIVEMAISMAPGRQTCIILFHIVDLWLASERWWWLRASREGSGYRKQALKQTGVVSSSRE